MRIVRSGLDEPIEIIAGLLRRGQRDGSAPAEVDPESAAKVCASIFQGLVLQQAWDPAIDIDGYIAAVMALITRFTEPSRETHKRADRCEEIPLCETCPLLWTHREVTRFSRARPTPPL
jgi:hypothetical protein